MSSFARKVFQLFVLSILVGLITVPVTYAKDDGGPVMSPEIIYDETPSVFGFIPPPPGVGDVPPTSGTMKFGAAPSSWDWRDHAGVTGMRNQNPYPVCWSFAGTGVLESQVLIYDSIEYDFSEYNIVQCNPLGTTCNQGGRAFYTTLNFTANGAVLEADDPFSQCDGSVHQCNDVDKIVTLLGWHYLANDLAELKDTIYNVGPIYSSIYASGPGFSTLGVDTAYYYTGTEPTDHAIVIVGYDDNMPVYDGATLVGNGAFLIRNSWGDWWSDDGYGWIAYGSAQVGSYASVFSEYQWYNPDEDLHYYDEMGYEGAAVGWGDSVAWGMVRISPVQDGILHRVDFWTTTVNTSYKIRIYDDFNGTTASNLLASQDGTCVKEGYYSIELDAPPQVTNGNELFVAVEFDSPGAIYPVPLERGEGTPEPNSSYLSHYGSSWQNYAARDVTIRARIIPEDDDTDGDGVLDSIEDAGCMDKNNPDSDGDGLCDGSLAVGSTCASGEDMNNDGVVDPAETDPCDPDSDDDGLDDSDDSVGCLSALNWDSDGDFLPDGYEDSMSGASPPLDPCNVLDGDADFDSDNNVNKHEYYNGSGMWSENPQGNAGCYFWGDSGQLGTANGIVASEDIAILKLALSGGVTNQYDGVIPPGGDTHEFDADDIISGGDLAVMMQILRTPTMLPDIGLPCRPSDIIVIDSPSVPVAVGDTCRITLAVENVSGTRTPGIGVIYEIDPSSTGSAVILGGDGTDGGLTRFDYSGNTDSGIGGESSIVLLVSSPGSIIVNASMPHCGGLGPGRFAEAIDKNAIVTVTGQ